MSTTEQRQKRGVTVLNAEIMPSTKRKLRQIAKRFAEESGTRPSMGGALNKIIREYELD